MRDAVRVLHPGEHRGGVFEQRLAVLARQPVAQVIVMGENIDDGLERMRVLVYRVVVEFDRRHPQVDAADTDAAMRELIDADDRHHLGNQDCGDQRQKEVQPQPLRLPTGSRKARFRIVGSGRHVVLFWRRRLPACLGLDTNRPRRGHAPQKHVRNQACEVREPYSMGERARGIVKVERAVAANAGFNPLP